jgi:hypothetical protein
VHGSTCHLVSVAVAVAVACLAVASTAGTAAGAKRPHVSARVANETLIVTADGGDPHIALRLVAGAPDELEIDADGDGRADYRFDRGRFDLILVDAGQGRGSVSIDESNGAFTDAIPTLIECRAGRQQLVQAGVAGRLELRTNGRFAPLCSARPRIRQVAAAPARGAGG